MTSAITDLNRRRRGERVVRSLDTDSVHVGVDDVGHAVDQRGVKHEDLVEARVHDVVAAEDQHDNNRRGDGRQRDVEQLLPLARAVDLRRLIQLRVNAGQRRKVDDRAPAGALVDVGDDQHRDEVTGVGEHLHVLARDGIDDAGDERRYRGRACS